MKIYLPIILTIVFASCSYKERKGLTADKRNYDKSMIEDFSNDFLQPSDAIYVFESNIHNAITLELTALCDSIFGEGFVGQEIIEEIKSTLQEKSVRYSQPNPEIQIDSKNIEQDVTLNENGYSSLKYKEDDLTYSSPLKLKASNLLTHDCISSDFDFSIGGYEVTFSFDATVKEVKKDGIYTVSENSEKIGSPYHKYNGNCVVGITIEAKDQDGKTEYYTRRIIENSNHYTQMQYVNSEVTYL